MREELMNSRKLDNDSIPVVVSGKSEEKPSKLKRLLKNLEASSMLEKLVEMNPDAIFVVDSGGYILFVNVGAEKLFHFSRSELVGKRFTQLLDQEYDPKYLKQLLNIIQRKKHIRTQQPVRILARTKEEKSFPVEISLNKISLDGEIRVIATVRDVTHIVRIEKELRKAHRETENLLSAISSALIGVDKQDRVTRWNRAAEKIFAIPAEKVVGKVFLASGIRWDWKEVLERIAESREQEKTSRWEYIRYERPDGKDGFLSMTVNPFKNEKGEYGGFILLATEVTERRLLEMQLAQAQKLESIGQLAAGIAHEINTPIQYVGDNLRFLQDTYQDVTRLMEKFRQLQQESKQGEINSTLTEEIDRLAEEIDFEFLWEEIPRALEQSLEGVKRVSKIVKAMKEFSHPGTSEKKLTDINKALENTLTVSRNEWKYVAEVVTKFDPNLPSVVCLPDELNQVFLNIIVNAAHAIGEVVGKNGEEKGKITIQTRQKGETVQILISDTGPGIPEKIRSKIFDPFFTTKEVGKGTGQGLAIAYNVVVEKHGGSISFETEEGKGTTFFINIPVK